jgi:hypothetical protein
VDAVDRLHQLGRAALQEAAAERVAQDADLLVGQLDRGARRARDHQLAGGVEAHRGLGAQVAHHLGAVLVLAAQLAQRGDRQEARADRARARHLGLAVDERLDALEGELAAAAHAGPLEAELGDRAAAVELDVEDQRAAIDVGADRHQALGQRARQHRHRQPGQVVAGAAAQRLGVERGAGSHVVRRVGDRVAQPEAAGAGLDVDRLIQVAGAGAVDRDERQRGASTSAGSSSPAPSGTPRPRPRPPADTQRHPWAAARSSNDMAAP